MTFQPGASCLTALLNRKLQTVCKVLGPDSPIVRVNEQEQSRRRAGAEQNQRSSRSRTGAEQEKSRSRAESEREQEQNRS